MVVIFPGGCQNHRLIQAIAGPTAQAAVVQVQTATGVTNGGLTVSATYPAAPTAGNLLIAIAGNYNGSGSPTLPSGWSTAKYGPSNTPGQSIYYKIAGAAEPTDVTFSDYPLGFDTRLGLHIYEYSGIDAGNPLDVTDMVDGYGTSISPGSVVTTAASSLIIAAFTANASTSALTWSDSFNEQNDFNNGGGPATQATYAGAHLVTGAAGTYTTTATTDTDANWRAQIVAFNALPPPANEYTVINTNDSGVGSLRAAIDYANLNPGTTISFDIPDTDPGYQTDGTDHWWRIAPTTSLANISSSGTVVDGGTQTSNRGDLNTRGPEIEIHGANAGYSDGLTIFAAGNVSISDLAITGFVGFGAITGSGIQINGVGASGVEVYGCNLGIDAVGQSALANTGYGIWVTNGANDLDLGGPGPDQGNLISGNSHGIAVDSGTIVRIRGNKIGTDRTGTVAVNNPQGILVSGTSSNITIGGPAAGEGNLVSGNASQISVEGSASSITMQGNIIGSDPSGTIDLSNGRGIELDTAADPSGIEIGGHMPGEGNLIAYNTTAIMGWWNGGGAQILGNTIRDSSGGGIALYQPNANVVGNLILNSNSQGIYVTIGATGTLVLHNTLHGNGTSGIEVATDGSAALHNNVITGSGTYGLFVSGGTLDSDSNNLITDGSTNPPNTTRCNVALDPTDLNADPLYVDAPGGDFSLTECSSPAIDAGIEIGDAQPDLNGPDPGDYNGVAPDMGALESSCGGIVQESAVTAVAPGGEFVVAWAASGQDGDGWGVYAQRYDATANPVGGEIQVHGTTTGSQLNPAVAMDDSGNFVVAWQTTHVDPSYFNVFAQRFNSSGAKQGGEFRVDAFSGADMQNPAVALDAVGNFAIAFEAGGNFDGQGAGIYTRWYSNLGVSLGNSRVNATGLGDQTDPAIAMDSVGNFVVAWASDLQDGDARGIYGQRFDSGGNTLGGEFPINATTIGDQFDPAVAMNGAGSFVVGWTGDDLLSTGIFAQNFAGDGGMIGCELPVNTTTSGTQEAPTVGMAPDGRFTVVWQDGFQEGDNGIYGQSFDPNLVALGAEFRVNSATLGDQNRPTMGIDDSNRIVVAWDGNGAGGGQIYLDRLAGSTDPFIIAENTTSATASGQSGLTWSHTVGDGANRYLTVGLAFAGGGPGSGTVTYGGVPLSIINSLSNQNAAHVQIWGLTAPASGTADIVVTLPSAEDFAAGATSYFGVDQSVPYGGETANTGTGSPAGITSTVPQGELKVTVIAVDSGPVVSPLSCQAERWNTGLASVTGAGGTLPGTGGAVTMSWDVGGNNKWVMATLSLKPALGLGSGIAGVIFEDADFAGTATEWDGGIGDVPLPGVDVELYTSGDGYLASTVTDATGAFSFTSLSDGDYKVRVRSATIGDADTPPAGGLNATVPVTWPYPLAEMTWGNGVVLLGGQSALADDTDTGDDLGPGDTWAAVTVNGGGVTGVNLGFAYNLIVNTLDDGLADAAPSDQGSLRQFLKNANAIGTSVATTASRSQFHLQVAANQTGGGGDWWRFSPIAVLPALTDDGTTLDGTTQTTNGGDTNSLGPEVEIFGSASGSVDGLILSGALNEVRSLAINGFSAADKAGIRIDGAAASSNRVAGCYIGLNADGAMATANYHGIVVTGPTNTIGGAVPADRNIISGNTANGVFLDTGVADGNVITGNYFGIGPNGIAPFLNSTGIMVLGAVNNTIGGASPGERNVIAGSTSYGIYLTGAGTQGNAVKGNYIGVNASGAAGIGSIIGVYVSTGAQSNFIGGTVAGEGNVISSNDQGVTLSGANTDLNLVLGNLIGTDATGTAAVANGIGVRVVSGADNNRIGGSTVQERNVISGNSSHGIIIEGNGTVTTGNTIVGNFIGTDVNGTAPLGNGDSGVRLFDQAQGNTVGGTTAAFRNVVSGNEDGIYLEGPATTDNLVQGNYIGTDAAGTGDLGNNDRGVQIESGADNNTVGGSAVGAGNVISGNDNGGMVIGDGSNPGLGATGNKVLGNYIGTDYTGTTPLGNEHHGVQITVVDGNSIGGISDGEGNIVANNSWTGVLIQNNEATGNEILRNAIFNNGGLGIDIGDDDVTPNNGTKNGTLANSDMDFPVLTTAQLVGTELTVAGYVGTAPGQSLFAGSRVEVFENDGDSSGYGEGLTYLGFLTADPAGNFSGTIDVTGLGLAVGEEISGTATDGSGNTSEFAANVVVVVAPLRVISGTVFEDADYAGTATDYDSGVGDRALPNVDVELYGVGDLYLASVTTAGDGSFSFAGLSDGTYKVRVRSATIGDSDTPPANGLHPTVPATWPYPLADMTWGHGSAIIGGQDPSADDTSTGDNAGPGDTWFAVTISGADVSAVNFGFNFDLVVNGDDDANADNVRSKQGCLRQFIKNSNAIVGVSKSWFQIP